MPLYKINEDEEEEILSKIGNKNADDIPQIQKPKIIDLITKTKQDQEVDLTQPIKEDVQKLQRELTGLPTDNRGVVTEIKTKSGVLSPMSENLIETKTGILQPIDQEDQDDADKTTWAQRASQATKAIESFTEKPITALMRSQKAKRIGGDVLGGFTGAYGDTLMAIPAAEARLGINIPGAEKAKNFGERLNNISKELLPEDPAFSDQLFSGVGSQGAYYLLGAGVASGANNLIKAVKLIKFLAPALGQGAMTAFESLTEMGGVYDDMVKKLKAEGQSDEIARATAGRSASKDFWGNVILIGTTNKMAGWFDGETTSLLKGLLKSMPAEGIQEGGQEIIASLSKREPINWKSVWTSTGIGAILGGIMKGGEIAVKDPIKIDPKQEKYLNSITPGLTSDIKKTIAVNIPIPNVDFQEVLKAGATAAESVKMKGLSPDAIRLATQRAMESKYNEMVEKNRPDIQKMNEEIRGKNLDIDVDLFNKMVDSAVGGVPGPESSKETVKTVEKTPTTTAKTTKPSQEATKSEKGIETPQTEELPISGALVPPIGSETAILTPQEKIKVSKAQAMTEMPKPNNVGEIPVSDIQIIPEKYQFRDSKFNEHKVLNMVENFDPYQLTPIIVRKDESGKFELLSGHHRLEMARRRGMDTLPAMIYEVDESTAKEIAKKSNSLAEGYTPLEEAQIFSNEISGGKTVAQIGKEYGGKSTSYVQGMLNLNNLSNEMKGLIRDRALDIKTAVVLGKAVQDYSLSPEIQSELYHKFIKVNDVTPGQLAQTLRVFGPKMMEQADFFGQLQGTETKKGVVTILNQVLLEIRAAEKESRTFKGMMKIIEGHRKTGTPLPQTIVNAYEDIQKAISSRVEKIKRLQEDIGKRQLPKLKFGEDMKSVSVGDIGAVKAPMGIQQETIPPGVGTLETPQGVVSFNSETVSPETVERIEKNDPQTSILFEKPRQQYRTAIRISGKEVFASQPGQSHASQVENLPEGWETEQIEIGYVDESGKFVTSEEMFPALYGNKHNAEMAVMEKMIKYYPKNKEFENWFGESKVVDEYGNPLVVYHGTGAGGSIAKKGFDYKYVDKGNNQFGSGWYFTNRPEVASLYTTRRRFQDIEKIGGDAEPSVIPVFLSIKNPIVIPPGKSNARDFAPVLSDKQTKDLILSAPEIKDPDGPLGNWGDIRHEGFNNVLKKAIPNYKEGGFYAIANDFYSGKSSEFLKQYSRITGKDGVIAEMESGEKHYVAWFPTQIKSAIGNRGTFDPYDPDITAEERGRYAINAPTFYSQLQKTIEQRMPNQAPAEQVKNIISDSKKEEVEWSGIIEYLEDKKTVSKKELLDYLRANEVKVEEVVKGKNGTKKLEYVESKNPIGLREWLSNIGRRDVVVREGPDEKFSATIGSVDLAKLIGRNEETFDSFEEVDSEIQKYYSETSQSGATKFQAYQLPGGENYQELLLTLPEKRISAQLTQINENVWRLGDGTVNITKDAAKFNVRGREGQLIHGPFISFDDAVEWANGGLSKPTSDNFKSSHFSEPNILAHVRFNERTDADGKRILFIEEVQSDWHQKGRERGYGKMLRVSARGAEDKRFNNSKDAEEYAKKIREETGEPATIFQETGLPDAPFKKSWHELAMKRMLRWSVENGFDKIAWTTGEQQAERYDLSKQVNKVEWSPETKELRAYDKNDSVVIEKVVEQNNLADFIGKDAAKKLTESKLKQGKDDDDAFKWHTIQGDDLKVGGEGMKGFYDKIIPSFLNKYTKKWGGKVGTTNIDLSTISKNYDEFKKQHLRAWPEATEEQVKSAFKTYAKAINKEVHSLDITQDMRNSIETQGQALFDQSAKFGESQEVQKNLFGEMENVKDIMRKNVSKQDHPELFTALAKPQLDPKFTPQEQRQIIEFPVAKTGTTEDLFSIPRNEIDRPQAIMESITVDEFEDTGFMLASKSKIERPSDVAGIFHLLKHKTVETFNILLLDENDNIMAVDVASIGTLNASLVHPRDMLKTSKLLGAKQIVLVHNHPSGDPSASTEDKILTKRLKNAAKSIGIDVKYHIIIDDTTYGLLSNDGNSYEEKNLIVPVEKKTQIPIVEARQKMREGHVNGKPITTPQEAARVIKTLNEKNGYYLLALDTRNKVSAIYGLGNQLKNTEEMVKDMSNLSIRNNAASFIIVTDEQLNKKFIQDLRNGMNTFGVEILDAIQFDGSKEPESARLNGWIKDGENPYSTNEQKDSMTEISAQQKIERNKKIGKIHKLRGIVGISDENYLRMKIDVTGKNSAADMNNAELEQLYNSIKSLKKPKPQRASKAEYNRVKEIRLKDVGGDALAKKIETELFGERVKGEEFSDEQYQQLIDKIESYKIDIRGHAVCVDIPGVNVDQEFADEVGEFKDLNGYELRFLDTVRQLKVINPTGMLKRKTFDMMDEAISSEQEEKEAIRTELYAIAGNIKPDSKESAEIMKIAEKGGTLTGKQKEINDYIRKKLNELRNRANVERKKYGKKEIGYIENYYTHMWERNVWDQFLNAVQYDRAMSLPVSDYTRPNAPFNPYDMARKGKLEYKYDAIGVFDRYLSTILKDIYYRGPIKQMRNYVKYLPGNAGRMLSRYCDDMAGKTSAMDRFGVIPEEVINSLVWLSNRATGNALVLNANFMLTNLSNPVIAIGEIGPHWVVAGQTFFMTPTGYNLAWNESKILKSRTNIFELNFSRYDGMKRFMAGQFIEYNNVAVSFLGGYLKAMNEGKSRKESIEYGDSIASQTQADYRKHALSPYLRSKYGKIFGKFQNYPFNLMHHIIYDKLNDRVALTGHFARVKNNFWKENKMGRMFMLAASVYLMNKLYEYLFNRSVYPISSFIPSLPFLPTQLQNQARPPVGFIAPKVFLDLIYWSVAYTKDEKNVKKAQKELLKDAENAAALFILPYGGVQVQRLLKGKVLPEYKKTGKKSKNGLSFNVNESLNTGL